MSDEEKEAKLELNRYIYGKNLSKNEIVDYLEIIFALIEKQQKEIEELKEINNETVTQIYIRISKKFKDKIKAKIEEIDMTGEIGYLVKGILQSLLEKE